LDCCADIEFQTWIKAVKASNLLWVIVIDEAHNVLIASDYCHTFKMLLKITDLAVQVALLMGTLSPHSEVALLQASIAPQVLPTLLTFYKDLTHGSYMCS
jgi:hypothetical protein